MPSKKILSPVFFILLLLLISSSGIAQDTFRAEMLKEVNNVRREGCQCGDEYMPPVRPLYWNDKLEKAAKSHARDMYSNNFFNHEGSRGKTLKDRVNATGYKWSFIGENISWGYYSVKEVVQGWIDSPDHCRNMMHPEFMEMGAAREGTYWVLDLAEKR